MCNLTQAKALSYLALAEKGNIVHQQQSETSIHY